MNWITIAWTMVVSILGLVWSLFRAGRTRLAVVAGGLNTIVLVANFVAPAPAVRRAVAVQQLPLFGATFTYAKVENGPWNLVGVISKAYFRKTDPGERIIDCIRHLAARDQ